MASCPDATSLTEASLASTPLGTWPPRSSVWTRWRTRGRRCRQPVEDEGEDEGRQEEGERDHQGGVASLRSGGTVNKGGRPLPPSNQTTPRPPWRDGSATQLRCQIRCHEWHLSSDLMGLRN